KPNHEARGWCRGLIAGSDARRVLQPCSRPSTFNVRLPGRCHLASIDTTTKTAELLELERKYCSFGDTVHYLEPPKVFVDCEGSYLYDDEGVPYLDLQMWYSAASFGYKNRRLNDALKRQVDRLPQLACQYLHGEKVEVAVRIAQYCEKRFGIK